MKLNNRTKILLGLVLATAFSAMLQYATQGILATGHDAKFFPVEFWIAEGVLWCLRALVEACVVAFLFSTKVTGKAKNILLGVLEFVLIALIAATIGPTLAATGYGVSMKDALPVEWYWLWNFGVGSYTSVMMAAAAVAYKLDESGVQQKQAPKASSSEAKILELLGRNGEMKPGAIARELSLEPWQVSRALKPMIENGLVEKPNGTVKLLQKA